PPEGQPATLPLLRPKDVVFSHSFYLDVGKFWEDRSKLLAKGNVEGLERFDKTSGRFLAGTKMSQLLTAAGSRHRIVSTSRLTDAYKTKPKDRVSSFAIISELREPEKFGKSMEAVLRGAAFLASTQVKLKLFEEKYKGCDIVAYRFDEKAPFKADV